MTHLPTSVCAPSSSAAPQLRVLPARRRTDHAPALTLTINPFAYSPETTRYLSPASLELSPAQLALTMRELILLTANQPGLNGFGRLRIPLTGPRYRVLEALRS